MEELIRRLCDRCRSEWATWQISFTVPFRPHLVHTTTRCDACAKKSLWPCRERGRVRIVPPDFTVPRLPSLPPRERRRPKAKPPNPWVDSIK